MAASFTNIKSDNPNIDLWLQTQENFLKTISEVTQEYGFLNQDALKLKLEAQLSPFHLNLAQYILRKGSAILAKQSSQTHSQPNSWEQARKESEDLLDYTHTVALPALQNEIDKVSRELSPEDLALIDRLVHGTLQELEEERKKEAEESPTDPSVAYNPNLTAVPQGRSRITLAPEVMTSSPLSRPRISQEDINTVARMIFQLGAEDWVRRQTLPAWNFCNCHAKI